MKPLLLALLLSASPETPTPAQAVEAWLSAFNAADADRLTATLSDRPGYLWVENGRIAFESKAATIARLPRPHNPKTAPRLEVVGDMRPLLLADDVAQVTLSIRTVVPDGKGAYVPVLDGVMTLTLVLDQGAWRILAAHSSTAPKGFDAD